MDELEALQVGVASMADPLLAQSGHSIRADECLLLGVKRTSGGGRFSFICAPSTSRGHDGGRAFHLLLDALNGAAADAALAGNLQRAFAGAQLSGGRRANER
jgi:hypothetical protein